MSLFHLNLLAGPANRDHNGAGPDNLQAGVRDGDGEQAVLPDRHGVHHRQRAHQALRVHDGEEVCPNPGPQCGDCK
jgi:hypothetical protein